MPKRKSKDNFDRIKRKIRRLERKLIRKQRSNSHNTGDSEFESTSYASHRSSLSKQEREQVDWDILSDNEDIVTDIDPLHSLVQLDRDQNEPGSSSRSPVNKVPSVIVVASQHVDHTSSTVPEPTPTGVELGAVTEELDDELMDILGSDPTTNKKYGKAIHNDLSIRLQHCATNGLVKELRKEFKEKYLTPENCNLIDPPELNAEIKAAVSDIIIKRDKAIAGKQKQVTLAISCLGEAITLLLTSKEKNTILLKLLMDAARIICDCQYTDTTTRKKFLLGAVKKDIREQLKNTKVDKFIFGKNLSEVLKSAKAINKSGTDLKITAPKIQNKKQTPSTSNTRNLNYKNSGPNRRPTGSQRIREPIMPTVRSRPINSLKQSQRPHRQQTHNRY